MYRAGTRELAARGDVYVWQELALVAAAVLTFASVCMLESLSE